MVYSLRHSVFAIHESYYILCLKICKDLFALFPAKYASMLYTCGLYTQNGVNTGSFTEKWEKIADFVCRLQKKPEII